MADPYTVAAIALPTIFSLFGGDGGQGEAVAAQSALNNELLKMFRKRENIELPFRKNLLQSLQARSQKKAPTFDLPTKPPAFNPWANMRTSMPLGARPATEGNPLGQASRVPMEFLRVAQGIPNKAQSGGA